MPDNANERNETKETSEEELRARAAARRISPLQYWESYIEFRKEYKDNGTMWNRDVFLASLKDTYQLPTVPSGSAVAGKHNYVCNTLLPQLRDEPNSPWAFMTDANIAKCSLPPTARDTKESWGKADELAAATASMFED